MNHITDSSGRGAGRRFLLGITLSAIMMLSFTGHAEDTRDLPNKEKRILVETICSRIETFYPFEDIGQKTREGIMDKLKSGEYDEIDSAKAFSATLTADMEMFSNDKHLDLYYDPIMAAEILAREEEGDAQSGPNPSTIEHARWENFGFKELRILHGNIGYLDLRMFFAARHGGPIAIAAMDFLSGTNAVIIDLRRNGGGWDDMVTFLAGYFVDLKEPELVALTQSTLDESYYASMISAFVPGNNLTDIPVYILISPSTASAAEAFTSIVKHLNESVVIVGQCSAGAENPVEFIALDHEFILKIPCYKKIDFGTRDGWEGRGVEPDLEVSSELALDSAHNHALEVLKQLHTGEIAQEKFQWGIDGKRAMLRPASIPETILQSYAGQYRSARMFIDNCVLHVQFGDRPSYRLLPVSSNYFVLEGRDDLRIRIMTDDNGVTGFERIYSDGYSAIHSKE